MVINIYRHAFKATNSQLNRVLKYFYFLASGDADVSPSDLSWGLLFSLISDQAAITGLEDLAMTDEFASLVALLSSNLYLFQRFLRS